MDFGYNKINLKQTYPAITTNNCSFIHNHIAIYMTTLS